MSEFDEVLRMINEGYDNDEKRIVKELLNPIPEVPFGPIPRWVKCEDRLPDFNIKILAYDNQRIYIAYRPQEQEYNEHWTVCEENDCDCNGCTGAITHWMPLPPVPIE